MSQQVDIRPPCPPFDRETAILKVRGAEDGWNTRDPERVSLGLQRTKPLAKSFRVHDGQKRDRGFSGAQVVARA